MPFKIKNPTYFIFHIKHAIVVLNNRYQLHENPSIIRRIKAKNRQIDDSQIGFVNNYKLKLNNKTLFKPPQEDKKQNYNISSSTEINTHT